MKRAEETRGDLPRIVNFLLSIGINNSTTHRGELKNLSVDAPSPKLYFFSTPNPQKYTEMVLLSRNIVLQDQQISPNTDYSYDTVFVLDKTKPSLDQMSFDNAYRFFMNFLI